MKRMWLVPLLALMMTGCSGIPTWIKNDVKDYVEDKLEQAKEDIIANAKKEVSGVIDGKIEELDKKTAEANRRVAEELEIDTSEFDIDGDGEFQPNEQAALAKEIALKGREKGWSWGTILMVIILVVFAKDAKGAAAWLRKRLNGNGSK